MARSGRIIPISLLILFGTSSLKAAAPAAAQSHAEIDVTRGTWLNVDVNPSGDAVVFDLLGDIYTSDLKRGSTRLIAGGTPYESQPRFSPDGAWIVFISDRSGVDNVWIMDRAGRNARQITHERLRIPSTPAWSRDGRSIVMRKHFTSSRSIGAGEIWVHSVMDDEERRLVERESDQKDISEPMFSPDGSLYFSRDVWPGATFEFNRDPYQGIMAIERLDPASGAMETVISGPGGAVRPTPSPDGRWLAFVTRAGLDHQGYASALMLYDLKTGATRVVEDRLDTDLQELWANHGYYPAFNWTPDSQALIFWARGKIWRKGLNGEAAQEIRFRARASLPLVAPPRATTAVAPQLFDVKALEGVTVSPDGQRVAYGALGRIWVQDLKAGSVRQLTRDAAGFESDPVFSPDGTWVLYAYWDDAALGAIRRTRISDGVTVTVTHDPGHYRVPVASPDGKVVFYHRVGSGELLDPRWSLHPGIYSTPWTGGPETRLAGEPAPPPARPFGVFDENLSIQFCGGHGDPLLMLGRPRRGKPPEDFWLPDRVLTRIDGRSGDSVEIAAATYASEMRISPDCRWIAYVDRGTIRVVRTPQDGGGTVFDPSQGFVLPGDGGYLLNWSDTETLYVSLGPSLTRWHFGPDGPVGRPLEYKLGFKTATMRPSGATAFINARIATMRGDDAMIENATVLIKGDRIAAVGPARDVVVPDNARVIDLAGRTVTPGLFDNHWHGPQDEFGITPQHNWDLGATLALGVTTIFDPSTTRKIFAISELAKAGKILSPRIFSTGPSLYGAEGDDNAVIESRGDARHEVRRRKAYGAIAVKSYLLPRREQRQWVVNAARAEDLFVAAEGAMAPMATISQIMDGTTSIEHAMTPEHVYDDVLQLWGRTSVDTVPTMVVGDGGAFGELLYYNDSDVWRHPILSRHVPPKVLLSSSARGTRLSRDDLRVLNTSKWLNQLQSEGIRVLPGGHGQREGLGLHWELWLMAEGGRSAYDILRAATIESAQHLGVDGDLGSIEVGKLADLVVFEADPLLNIRHSDQIRYVIANGRVLEPKTLREISAAGGDYHRYFWEKQVQ